MRYSELRNLLKALDGELNVNADGFVSYGYGIGVEGNEHHDIISSVIVFKRGYYN